jgi:hypothetical protein
MMIHRSGSQAVKDYLQQINRLIEQRGELPIEICTILAKWSTDSYYAIVISKNNGISTIIKAMECWSKEEEEEEDSGRSSNKAHSLTSRFQACCIRILHNLSLQSVTIKDKIIREGAKEAIKEAALRYPRSIDLEDFKSLMEYEVGPEKEEGDGSSKVLRPKLLLESKVLRLDTTVDETTTSSKVVAYF